MAETETMPSDMLSEERMDMESKENPEIHSDLVPEEESPEISASTSSESVTQEQENAVSELQEEDGSILAEQVKKVVKEEGEKLSTSMKEEEMKHDLQEVTEIVEKLVEEKMEDEKMEKHGTMTEQEMESEKNKEDLVKKEVEILVLEELRRDEGKEHHEPEPTISTKEESPEKEDGRLMGITPDGNRFYVPKTKDAVTFNVKEWSLTDYLQYGTAIHVLLLFTNAPAWFYIANFLFWRICYNVGLGYLLHIQSSHRTLTRFFEHWQKDPKIEPILIRIASSGMGSDYDFGKAPTEFNAWLVYRALVDFVLANDVSAYVVFVLKFMILDFPEQFTFLVFCGYLLGILLCGVTLWAKMDAYRVVKDFAWYWGDFFFLIDVSLTFDRVFALVPHPMYTIGYAFYYGCALLSQSYTVLYVSLIAHTLQLVFLAFVENPHIEKTYPEMAREQDQEKQTILYDKERGYFRRDMIAFKNLDIFRSSDAFLVLFLIYMCLVYLLTDLGVWWYAVQAMVWRVIHSIGLGYILYQQDTKFFWVSHFEKRNGTKQDAFRSWKRIYNFSQVMTWCTFVLCALTLHQNESFVSASFFARQMIGGLLIALNIWSSVSTFEVLGEFGWFYGDFFIDEVPSTLYYTGIYRFLNNPDIVTGCAGLYGLALMSGSSKVFGLALASQVLNWLFIYYVERPHMQRLHGDKVRDTAGSLLAARVIASEAITQLRRSDQGAKLLKGIENATEKYGQVLKEKTASLREQIRTGFSKEKDD